MGAPCQATVAFGGWRSRSAAFPAPARRTPIRRIITFVRGSERISYFSMISTVGFPQDITAQEFRIECMFPTE
jgi:hypothetical protein